MLKSDPSHLLLFAIGIGLWGFSLPMVVGESYFAIVGFPEASVHGYDALILGWFLFFVGCPAWLANPTLVVVWFLLHFQQWSNAVGAASLAVCFALSILIWYSPFPPSHDQNGSYLCLGGWFWIASIGCVWASSYLAWRHHCVQVELH